MKGCIIHIMQGDASEDHSRPAYLSEGCTCNPTYNCREGISIMGLKFSPSLSREKGGKAKAS